MSGRGICNCTLLARKFLSGCVLVCATVSACSDPSTSITVQTITNDEKQQLRTLIKHRDIADASFLQEALQIGFVSKPDGQGDGQVYETLFPNSQGSQKLIRQVSFWLPKKPSIFRTPSGQTHYAKAILSIELSGTGSCLTAADIASIVGYMGKTGKRVVADGDDVFTASWSIQARDNDTEWISADFSPTKEHCASQLTVKQGKS
jgi:hypothetical protein